MKTRTSITRYFQVSLGGALICAATLAACTRAAGNLPLVTPEEGRAAIVPVAGVTAARASSRGDLSPGPVTGSAFPANTGKLFAVTAYAGPAATPPANVPSSVAYFNNQAVESDGTGKLSFTDPQYYPPSSDVKLYFYAYSPLSGTYAAGDGSTTAPAVTWDLDGQQDVMYASVTSGIGKEEGTQTHPEFGFQHLLARVQFKLVQGTGFGGGINVTEISLNALNTRASLDLVTGALTWTHRGGVAHGDKLSLTGTFPIKPLAEAAVIEPCLMAPPGFAGGTGETVNLSVKAGGIEYPAVSWGLPEGLQHGQVAGKSYLVTLTFEGTTIKPAVQVTPWEDLGYAPTHTLK